MKKLLNPTGKCGHRGFSATVNATAPRASGGEDVTCRGTYLCHSFCLILGMLQKYWDKNWHQDPLGVLLCEALEKITCSQIP